LLPPQDTTSISHIRELMYSGHLTVASREIAESNLAEIVKRVELVIVGILQDSPVGQLLEQLPDQDEIDALPEDSLARWFLARAILFNRGNGGFDLAVREMELAQQLYREHPAELHPSEILLEWGKILAWTGQELKALRNYTQALTGLMRQPQKGLEFQCFWCLGKLSIEMGRWEEALNYLSVAGDVLSDRENDFHIRYVLDVCQALLGAEQYRSCQEALLGLPKHQVSALSYPYRQLVYHRTLALSFIRSGDESAAKESMQSIQEKFDAAGLSDYERLEIQRLQAEFEQAFGDTGRALELYEPVLSVYAERSYIQPCLDLMSRMAHAQVTVGDPGAASNTLQAAIDLAHKHGTFSSIPKIATTRERLGLSEVVAEESGRVVGRHLRSRSDAYVLLEKLGSGAFGSVYRARDMEQEREVALKQITFSTHDGRFRENLKSSLRAEIQSCAGIRHPGVAKVLSWGQDSENELYITQEYVKGPTLRSCLGSREFTLQQCLSLMRDILLSLDEIHRGGIVHCDLKPENVILREGQSPVIVDFGIARQRTRRSKAGENVGTLLYMSPEALLNLRLRPATDIYAAGLIFLELLGCGLPGLESRRFTALTRRHRAISAIARTTSARPDIADLDPLPAILRDLVKLELAGRPGSAYSIAQQLEIIRKNSHGINRVTNVPIN